MDEMKYKSRGEKSFPQYRMDSRSYCYGQMNVPISLEASCGTRRVPRVQLDRHEGMLESLGSRMEF